MSRNSIVQTPSDEAKTALDGAQSVSIANAIAVISSESASSASPSALTNNKLLEQCDDHGDILNGIKVFNEFGGVIALSFT